MYPVADKDKCIRCGKCEKYCPVINGLQRPAGRAAVRAYGARSKKEEIRKKSSSGGIFTELAAAVLEKGGVVFGAALDEHMGLWHIAVKEQEGLERLRGSKYVQSQIGPAYRQAKEALEESRTVLFTGTPCQIAGLYSFLGRPYEKLYTQDIICHGVPSPLVWKSYIRCREKKAGSPLRAVSFRHKDGSWRRSALRLEFADGRVKMQKNTDDLYLRSFLSNLCLRPSCYACAFKTKERLSDFTLADFWGVEKLCPELDDDGGTSLVLVNSPKGAALFEGRKEGLLWREVDFEKAIEGNSAMVCSVPRNENRERFMACIKDEGFQEAAKKCLKLPWKARLKRLARRLLGRG